MKKFTDRNPHTGEKLQTKPASDAYRENHDKIFGSKTCAKCKKPRKNWEVCEAIGCVNTNYDNPTS